MCLSPPQEHFWWDPVSRNPLKLQQKLDAIQHLWDISAVERVPPAQRGVYLVFFLVPKRNGKMRDLQVTIQAHRVSCQDVVAWSRFHTRPLQSTLYPFLHLVERRQHRSIPITWQLRDCLE